MRQAAAVLVLAIALIGVSTGASADVLRGEYLIAPRGNFAMPQGDFPINNPQILDESLKKDLANNLENGFGFGLQLERIVTERIGVGLTGGVNFNAIDDKVLQDFFRGQGNDSTRTDYKTKTIYLTGYGRYYLAPQGRISPFGHLGAGFFIHKTSSNEQLIVRDIPLKKRSETGTGPGLTVGPGVLVRVSREMRLSLEGLFNIASPGGDAIKFFNLSVGLVFGVTPQ